MITIQSNILRGAFALAFLVVGACGDTKTVDGVACKADTDCKLSDVQGTCSSGFCAFPDTTCEGGLRYSPGATGMENQCVGGVPACGTMGASCCTGDVCGDHLACSSGTCTCGDTDGAPCCDGTTCGTNLACNAEGACACGGDREPCCGGSTCDTGLSCSAGSCVAGVEQVSIARASMCAVRTDGKVSCWGTDETAYGQRPNTGHLPVYSSLTPEIIPITSVAEVQRGDTFACARKTDGTVWCWGQNRAGQLGNGTQTPSRAPVQVTGLTAVTQLQVGRQHACAVGTVNATTGMYCWGRNQKGRNGPGGRLGNGALTDSSTPVAVDMSGMANAGQTVTQIAVSGYHTCALMSDQRIWCWGGNANGELGTGNGTEVAAPALVDLSQITIPGGVTIASISTGVGRNSATPTCMLLSSGTAYCWGRGDSLGTGVNSAANRPATPVSMTALGTATFTQLSPHVGGVCGLDSMSRVWCWGQGMQAQLGNNDATFANQLTPVQVTGLPTTVTKLVTGHRVGCVLDGSKGLWCWGNNHTGVIRQARPTSAADGQVLQAIRVTP